MVARTDESMTGVPVAASRDEAAKRGRAAPGPVAVRTVVAAAAGYVLCTAVAAPLLDTASSTGRLLWTLLPVVASSAFAAGCAVVTRRCEGQRRRFWFVLTVGVTAMVAAQVWRAMGTGLGFPIDPLESVYAGGTTVGIATFTAALVVRLRMIAPTTWGVQLLDAAGLAVVISTVVALPLANALAAAPLDVHLTVAQPLLLVVLASGTGGLLLTPVSWNEKRTEAVLFVATSVGVVQAWVEVYGFVHTGDRYLPATLVLLGAAFAIAAVSPVVEDPSARTRSVLREDYDTAALPYVALGVLPVLAVWMVIHGTTAQEIVTVTGMLAGFVVAVLRQVQVLHTQRVLLERERALTEERRQDTLIAGSLLAVAGDLALSPDRVAAQRAVLAGLAAAVTPPVVRIIDASGQVAGDVSGRATLGPDAAIALAVDPQRRAGSGAPRRFGDPTTGVEGLLAPALDSKGAFSAVVCAEGRGWSPSPNETDLVAGVARQLGVALERSDLLERLADSEARYLEIIDHLPVGIVEVDSDGVVARTNAAFARLCGRDPAEIAGGSVAGQFAAFESEPPDALDLFAASEHVRCRARVSTFAGGERYVEIDAARLASSRERRDGVLIVRDVTAKTRLQARIRHAAARLETQRGADDGQGLAAACAGTVLLMDEAASLVGRLDAVQASAWPSARAAARDAVGSAIAGLDALVSRLELA